MKNEGTHHGQPIEEHKDVFDVWRSHNLGTMKVRWEGRIGGLYFDEILDLETAKNEALTLMVSNISSMEIENPMAL